MSRTFMKVVCLGAFALAFSAVFATDAATLQVAISGSDVNVTAPAGALDDTSKIYLAWGATDFGDDMASWPSANRALYSGAVSSAAATYTFDGTGIPAGSIVRAFATSDIRLIDSWVKIAANQYINTGILGIRRRFQVPLRWHEHGRCLFVCHRERSGPVYDRQIQQR